MQDAPARPMNRSLAAYLLLVPLAACVNEPIATVPSNNPDVQVDTLFTHDGCTVYRFRDGPYQYFVKCQGERTASTISTLSCGKNCRYEDTIQSASLP